MKLVPGVVNQLVEPIHPLDLLVDKRTIKKVSRPSKKKNYGGQTAREFFKNTHVASEKKEYLDWDSFLKEKVIESGLSLNELQRRTGIASSTFCRIRKGRGTGGGSIFTLIALFRGLDLPLEELRRIKLPDYYPEKVR